MANTSRTGNISINVHGRFRSVCVVKFSTALLDSLTDRIYFNSKAMVSNVLLFLVMIVPIISPSRRSMVSEPRQSFVMLRWIE
jgi:hypothetical protein